MSSPGAQEAEEAVSNAQGAASRGFGARVVERLTRGLPHPPEAPSLAWKPVIILVSTAVLLALLWYYGRPPFYRKAIGPYFTAQGIEPVLVELYGYFYLAASSIVTRMLAPLAIILFVFKQRPRDYGYRVRGTRNLGVIYLGLLAVMLPVLYFASADPVFQQKYPLYDYAGESLGIFVAYELSYVLVFLSGESFWRGFMIFGLAPRFGLYSLAIMAIPYSMVHFGKPFPEALGAILTGLVLGYLALRHRSFWLGVALHSSIGFTMDVLCLWRKGMLGPLLGL